MIKDILTLSPGNYLYGINPDGHPNTAYLLEVETVYPTASIAGAFTCICPDINRKRVIDRSLIDEGAAGPYWTMDSVCRIPLTFERIKRLGFAYNHDATRIETHRIWVKNGLRITQDMENETFLYRCGNPVNDTELFYVDELQNLFFTLFKQQLKYQQ